MLVGTFVTKALAKVGIKETRVASWLNMKNCGCRERRRRLNALHQWARGLLRGKLSKEDLEKELDDEESAAASS